MKATELFEAKARSIICIDIQPEYSGMKDGDENPIFVDAIDFVLSQKCPVFMLVNAEQTGITSDTIDDIMMYWEDTAEDLKRTIDWDRFEIFDKGYGYFRSWMDYGVDQADIIKTIREMYRQKVNDTRLLFGGEDDLLYAEKFQKFIGAGFDKLMLDEPLLINWVSVAKLKQYEGSLMIGGGRSECLREVELLMNAFNIRYKRVDSLIYGD